MGKCLTNGSSASVPAYEDLLEGPPGYRCSHDYFNAYGTDSGKKDQLGTVHLIFVRFL